jgi:hypothetical protein
MSIATISCKRRSRLNIQQSNPPKDTLKGIFPRDHLYARIRNTVADATLVNDLKVNLTNEYNHASMRRPQKRRQARDDVLKKIGRATMKQHKKDLDDTT